MIGEMKLREAIVALREFYGIDVLHRIGLGALSDGTPANEEMALWRDLDAALASRPAETEQADELLLELLRDHIEGFHGRECHCVRKLDARLATEDLLAPSSIAPARLEEAPAPGSAAEPTPQRPSEAPAPAPRAHEKSEADPRPGGAS